MCVMNDVMYVLCKYVCLVLGCVARLIKQRNPNTTPQQSYHPPITKDNKLKKIMNIKHHVCCVMLCVRVYDMS
jgi:hypothetical protein